MRTRLVLILLIAPICLPQTRESSATTFGVSNGRFWQSFTSVEKITYLAGVFDGFLSMDTILDKHETPNFFAKGSNLKEYVTAVDLFYQEPANLPIPLSFALRAVTMKANGEDAAEIGKATEAVRRKIAESQK